MYADQDQPRIMPTASSGKQVNSEEAINPIHGPKGVLLFFLLVSATLFVLINACSSYFHIILVTAEQQLIILFTIQTMAIVSFSLAINFKDFLLKLFIIILLIGPLFYYIAFEPSVIFFLLIFLAMTLCALYISAWKSSTTILDKISTTLYILWIIVGVFLTIYKLGYLPKFRGINQMLATINYGNNSTSFLSNKISLFLDLRMIMTIMFGTFLTAISLINACRSPLPTIHTIRILKSNILPKRPSNLLNIFLYPITVLALTVINIIQILINAIWKILAIICYYIYRFTYSITNILYQYLTSKLIWMGLVKTIFTYAVSALMIYGILWLSPLVIDYVRLDITLSKNIEINISSMLLMLGIITIMLAGC